MGKRLQNVTSRQKHTIALLASGKNITEACESVGVSRQTVNRWLSEAFFRSELQAVEDERYHELARSLAGLDAMAVQALKESLSCSDKRLRLRAVDIHLRIRSELETVKLEERLHRLEKGLLERNSHERGLPERDNY